jgi:hypothetical protein
MAGKVSGAALGIAALGTLLAWSGLKGKKITSVFRDIIAGKSPADATGTPITDPTTYGGEISAATGNTGAESQTAAHNQAIAKMLATPLGWGTGQQWEDLVSLWNQESGWNNTADNGSSGAYGIAQALPSTKYPVPGRPPSEGGVSNPTTQIAWGLAYIGSRYGSPSGAWAHEVANNWY